MIICDYLWHDYHESWKIKIKGNLKKAKSPERCRIFFQRTKAQRILSMSRNLVTDTITYLLLGASKGRGWTREESENSWNFWMLEDGTEILELFLLINWNCFMIWSVLVNIMWCLLVLVDGSWKKLANESRFAAVTNVLDRVCYWPDNYQKQSWMPETAPYTIPTFAINMFFCEKSILTRYTLSWSMSYLWSTPAKWTKPLGWLETTHVFQAWTQRPERYGCREPQL